MSRAFTASIVPARGKLYEAAIDLTASLAQSATLRKVTTDREKQTLGIERPEIDTWDKLFDLIESSNIFESDSELQFTVQFETQSGQTAGFEVVLSGRDLFGGGAADHRGQLTVHLDNRLKATGFWWNDKEAMRGPYGLRAEWDGWRELLVLLSLQGPFDYSATAQHMGVFIESNWGSPDFSSAQYHSDIGEFVRDFKRTRQSFHTPGLYYGAYSGTWEPSAHYPWGVEEHQRRRLDFYDILGAYDPTGDRGRLARFVQSLTEEQVETAWEISNSLDSDEIEIVLSTADSEIRFEKLASGGLLYAEPSTPLYPAYIALWEFVLEAMAKRSGF